MSACAEGGGRCSSGRGYTYRIFVQSARPRRSGRRAVRGERHMRARLEGAFGIYRRRKSKEYHPFGCRQLPCDPGSGKRERGMYARRLGYAHLPRGLLTYRRARRGDEADRPLRENRRIPRGACRRYRKDLREMRASAPSGIDVVPVLRRQTQDDTPSFHRRRAVQTAYGAFSDSFLRYNRGRYADPPDQPHYR